LFDRPYRRKENFTRLSGRKLTTSNRKKKITRELKGGRTRIPKKRKSPPVGKREKGLKKRRTKKRVVDRGSQL